MYTPIQQFFAFLQLPVDVTPIAIYIAIALAVGLLYALFGIFGKGNTYIKHVTVGILVLLTFTMLCMVAKTFAFDIITEMARVGAYT